LSDAPDPLDPSAQLEALKQQLGESNPDLYRHLALYLQVLRQVLPHRVRQACFHLATQIHPQRYAELPEERRRLLHQQIDGLVHRCSSLLTVEQLAVLADQICREGRRRERQEQQQLLAELSWDVEADGGAEEPGDLESLPPGSVQLALAPPLTGLRFGWGQPPSHPAGQAEPLLADGEPSAEEDPEDADREVGRDEGEGSSGRMDSSAGSHQGDIRSLAQALAAAAEGHDPASGPEPPVDTVEPSLWQPGPLPLEPHQVLLWLDGMEQALGRRLRNLSHAINVELLRAGVNSSLLPVSLLDAVLAGQLDTMAAPANITRLPLPFGRSRRGPRSQTMAVLLRPAELELEEPRLRTCRRRLQQHRQEVRRMAQQFRRLQRRVRIHQAEQLWMQDIRPIQNPAE
jgi:hypothetical protein